MTGPEDLLTDEGVDEGSAASSAEGDGGPDPDADVVGAPPHGGPADEAQAAGPQDVDDEASRAARDSRGTGQQLQEGEG